MVRPRTNLLPIFSVLLASLCLLASGIQTSARAQQTPSATTDERERGVNLYRQGDVKGAVKALQAAVKAHKDDADAWYYLSLALNRDKDYKGARQAVEKAVKLRPDFAPARSGLAYFLMLSNKLRDAQREADRALAIDPQNVEAHYVAAFVRFRQNDPAKALDEIESALRYKPDYPAALLVKSQILLGLYVQNTEYKENESDEVRHQRTKRNTDLLRQAAESLEKYFQLNPSPPNADVWREQLETLRVYAQVGKPDGAGGEATVFVPSKVTTKARILSRAEPQYTEEARRAQVSGTVVMRAVFAADGTIRNILVLHSLPYGLTEAAVRAARKIKFVPATKDGKPVSQFIQIEYNFNLY